MDLQHYNLIVKRLCGYDFVIRSYRERHIQVAVV